jgi:putative phosphoesterase
MKIAFFSDIHANVYALKRAIESAGENGAGNIYVAGDLISRGPHPEEVIALMREYKIPAIRGNVERKLLKLRNDEKKLQNMIRVKKSKLAWTALQLSSASWKYIESLPLEMNLRLNGVKALIVHGSPLSDRDYIYPSITSSSLHSRMIRSTADILVCGHTHIPFIKVFGGLRVINCGAAGVSIDGDPRPSYALLEIKGKNNFHCRIVRFEYQANNLVSDIERMKMPGVNGEIFLRGMKQDRERV